MLNSISRRLNRSYEKFTISGPFLTDNAKVADMLAHPEEVPMLRKPYLSSGKAIMGQIDGPVPGVPMQSLVTVAPGNVQRNKTGPVSARDIVAALLERRKATVPSSAGQSAFT